MTLSGIVSLPAEHVGDGLHEHRPHLVVGALGVSAAKDAQADPVDLVRHGDAALFQRRAAARHYFALGRDGLALACGHPLLGEADESAELLVYCVYHGFTPLVAV